MSLRTQDPAPKTMNPLFRWSQYLLWFMALWLLLYVAPFCLIRLPRFEQWSTSPYGRDLEYGMNARNINADIVIYGDSSALYGIDPLQMSSVLGLKVFSIPNVLPSLLVVHDMGLQRYLQANKPPRLIIFYFSVWNLDFSNMPVKSAYDGDEMLLRHGNAGQLARFYRDHLPELLQFPLKFYRVNSPTGLAELLHPPAAPEAMAVSLGHRVMHSSNAIQSNCTLAAISATGKLAAQTVEQLRAQYETAQTKTIVYVAPIPECANSSSVIANDFTQIGAAPPLILPASNFANDTYYAHPLAGSVIQVTSLLIQTIRPLLVPAR